MSVLTILLAIVGLLLLRQNCLETKGTVGSQEVSLILMKTSTVQMRSVSFAMLYESALELSI